MAGGTGQFSGWESAQGCGRVYINANIEEFLIATDCEYAVHADTRAHREHLNK